jgi:hypothetical protein
LYLLLSLFMERNVCILATPSSLSMERNACILATPSWNNTFLHFDNDSL